MGVWTICAGLDWYGDGCGECCQQQWEMLSKQRGPELEESTSLKTDFIHTNATADKHQATAGLILALKRLKKKRLNTTNIRKYSKDWIMRLN